MICNKCGNNLNLTDQICNKCGNIVPQNQRVQQNPTTGAQMVSPTYIPAQQSEVLDPQKMNSNHIQTQPEILDPQMVNSVQIPTQPEVLEPQMLNQGQVQPIQQISPSTAQPVSQMPMQAENVVVQASQNAVQPVPAAPVQPTVAPVQPTQAVAQPMMMQSTQQYVAPNTQMMQPMQANIGVQPQATINVTPVQTGPIHKAPPKRKAPLIITGVVALFALVAIVATLLKPTEEIVLAENGTRTVMVYIIGSNLESSQGSATFDIEEMLKAKFASEDVKVLLYTGGTKKWYTSEIPEDENAIFEVKNGELIKKKTYDKQIMTKPGPLTDFLNYAYENYKTDLYDLILWDHGGGPIYGYGQDENDVRNSLMSLEVLNDAINDSKLRKDKKLDFIGFDACLMGSLEVAYSLKKHANYLIASEENEPGYGWNYDFLSNVTSETETKDLGKFIIDDYFKFYDEGNYKGNLTLSMIELDKVDELIESVDSLFKKADGGINVNNFSSYARKLTRKTVYGNTGRAESAFDLVDLLDLSNSISDDYPNETADVEKTLNSAIVYSKDNMSNTNGISIYFPTNNKKNIEKILKEYNNVKISKNYYNFLKKYSSYITGNRLVNQNTYRDIMPTYTSESVSVELSEDLVNNYEKADYIIFRKLGENNYIPVYKSTNVTLEGNKLSAVPGNRQLIVDTPAGGEPGWATMYEVNRENGYTDYNVVAIIERYDEEADPKLQLSNINILYRVKDGESEGEIVDVQLMSTGEAVSKTSLDLEKWEKIQFFNASYKLFDENNEYLAAWESYKDYYLSIYDLKEGFKLKFVDLDYDLSALEFNDMDGSAIQTNNCEYYYMFRVRDTQGDLHQINLVKSN